MGEGLRGVVGGEGEGNKGAQIYSQSKYKLVTGIRMQHEKYSQ